MYVLNKRASKFMRQKLTEFKGEIDEPTIIVGGSNIPLSIIDRTSRWRPSEDMDSMKKTVNQLDPTDKTLYPTQYKS